MEKEFTFTTPCYMVNDPAVWNLLEEIGYEPTEGSVYEDEKYLYVGNDGYATEDDITEIFYPARKIACGRDTVTFLGIAAIRDDSDYMQWFICNFGDGEGVKWIKSQFHNFYENLKVEQQHISYRKATAEEIFNHFY